MKDILNIVLLQLAPVAHRRKICAWCGVACRKPKALGAGRALFSEMQNTGYAVTARPKRMYTVSVLRNESSLQGCNTLSVL